jgi:anthranilate phosphoribosyltransferase
LTPAQVAEAIEKVGIGFMFAPSHHPAMKYAAPVRKELGMRTILNILGPLTNPAGAPNQVMGVFHTDLVGIQARVLKQLGSKHVMVVHGEDGLDEITLSGKTQVAELKHGFVTEFTIEPKQFGLDIGPLEPIRAVDADASKSMLLDVLNNKAGPAKDIVMLNAGAAIYVAGITNDLWGGVSRAREMIETGLARKKLDELVGFTTALAPEL